MQKFQEIGVEKLCKLVSENGLQISDMPGSPDDMSCIFQPRVP